MEARRGGGVAVHVPFDPAAAWGDKERHYVTGTIQGHRVRGTLTAVGDANYLLLGPAWCRDPRVGAGAHVTVSLAPEGPQFSSLASDLQAALGAEPAGAPLLRVAGDFLPEWIRGLDRGGQAPGNQEQADRRGGRCTQGRTEGSLTARQCSTTGAGLSGTNPWAAVRSAAGFSGPHRRQGRARGPPPSGAGGPAWPAIGGT